MVLGMKWLNQRCCGNSVPLRKHSYQGKQRSDGHPMLKQGDAHARQAGVSPVARNSTILACMTQPRFRARGVVVRKMLSLKPTS